MLVLDELKKNDPHLRLLAVAVAAGLFVLLAGLWWVQVVSASRFQSHLETQSYRTVRIPAVRGNILDRNGRVIAENRPGYGISLYLEDLRKAFITSFNEDLGRARAAREQLIAAQEKKLGRSLTTRERRSFSLTRDDRARLQEQARFRVASNVVAQVSRQLQQPLAFDAASFERHYQTRLALPYCLVPNVSPVQIARFEEQFSGALGADLEIQPTRFYPNGTTASHVLGHLQRDDNISVMGEDAFFSYRLPDYRGVVGVEGCFDEQLRGRAGVKSVLVNNLGYRQTENVWTPASSGKNLVLTLDLEIQQAAERSLARHQGERVRGAAVVMDVRTGDLLALVSSPSLDPNYFVRGFPASEIARWNDPKLKMQKNLATQENYAPGSIFKTVTALACLEAGLDPKRTIENPGHIYIGRRFIDDLAPAGTYDFKRALKLSSNTYFITNGLHAGIETIVRLGQRLHLGERAGLPTWQETSGSFPSLKRVSSNWRDGDTANICIGQGELAVTPLQMAVMTAAIANGGTVLWPRLVDRIEPQDPASGESPEVFPSARVRNDLGVRPRSLKILHEAMLADVEESDGTGRAAAVPGLKICGKTGTAQIKDEHNRTTGDTLWFTSFAPYEAPRYVVLVMVESDGGGSGGGVCAPVAHDIYVALQKRDAALAPKLLARTN